MNLHRAGKEGQWESIPPEDRNVFQHVAAATKGIVTPGNVASATGAVIVASGLKDIHDGKTGKGIAKVGVGRTFDLIDGTAADKTGTKGPIGEAADVVVDKAEAAVGIPTLAVAGVLPEPATAVITYQNIANGIIASDARSRGIALHPSREGKLTTAGQWATIGFYGLSKAAEEAGYQKMAKRLELAGHITTFATAWMGAKAIAGYNRDVAAEAPQS